MFDAALTGRCRECGAHVRPGVTACWLCASRLAEQESAAEVSEQPSAAPPEASLARYSVSELMVLVTLVCLALGVWVVVPGIGMLLAVVLVPVAVRTLLVIRRRSALGLETTGAQKLKMTLLSAIVTIVIIQATAGAAAIALIVSCFVGIGAMGLRPNDETLVWVIFGGGQLIALFLIGWLVAKWVRRRWKRDTTTE